MTLIKTIIATSPVADLAALPSASQLGLDVRHLSLLEGLDEGTIQKITTVLKIRTAERGECILEKWSAGSTLLFLLTGRLQAVDITEDGREIGLSFLMPGDYFGELSVIDGLPRSATVIACDRSSYALLPRHHALDLMHHHPLIAERMFKRLASSIRRTSTFRTILGIPNAYKRVYALLDYLMQTSPGGLVVIENLPSQQEIAIMINTSRETVSRAIQALIQRGILEKDLRRLIVRDPDALRREL